ncbi:MAG: GNAT family N-acetyltransferase [Alphaproteobacteria bacterium]|nr:GNAT family N-acetyltransferase [Alphaproteobacteria bacterium]
MIQTLAPSHTSDIAALDALCFPEGPFSESIVKPMFSLEGFIALGQYENGKLICCLLGHTVLDEAELWSIATCPDYRGKGLARNIFKTFEDQIKKSDVKRLFWEVRRSNDGAQKFYEKLGAQQFGERKGFYTSEDSTPAEDALLYRKDL